MRSSPKDRSVPHREAPSASTPDCGVDASVKAEILQDLRAYNAYIEEYGSPADLVRAHYAARDDAV